MQHLQHLALVAQEVTLQEAIMEVDIHLRVVADMMAATMAAAIRIRRILSLLRQLIQVHPPTKLDWRKRRQGHSCTLASNTRHLLLTLLEQEAIPSFK